MIFDKKNKYVEKKNRSWREYITGDLWFEAYVSRDQMHIIQRMVEPGCEDGDEVSSMSVPVDVLKDAIIESMIPEGAISREYDLALVPVGTETRSVDVVSLKMYRDRLEALFKAQQGLADARQAFGWQSEAAKFAEKVVGAMEKQVDAVYAQLIGDPPAQERNEL